MKARLEKQQAIMFLQQQQQQQRLLQLQAQGRVINPMPMTRFPGMQQMPNILSMDGSVGQLSLVR